jgi:hypothetical protein
MAQLFHRGGLAVVHPHIGEHAEMFRRHAMAMRQSAIAHAVIAETIHLAPNFEMTRMGARSDLRIEMPARQRIGDEAMALNSSK